MEVEDTEFRSPSQLALACLLEALDKEYPVVQSVPVVPIIPEFITPIEIGSNLDVTKPVKMEKHVESWERRRQERIAMVDADSAMGRWAKYTITAGEIGVNRFTPIDDQGLRDFGDEIYRGSVVQESIPWHFNAAQIAEYVRGWNRRGRRFVWAYIGGDCESFENAQEIRRRHEIRTRPELSHGIEAVIDKEKKEAIERAVFGREMHYIKLAASDCVKLAALAARDGIPPELAIPANLAHVVQSAVALGWSPDTETRRALLGPHGAFQALPGAGPLLLE